MAGDYYNEVDAYAAQWLRNLIAAGHLPDGDVDERSITEVQPEDLKGFTRCHWFAGIGIWPLALRRAGLDDLPVWTGSCPCQPFSAAGKQKGFDDARHLWPVWFNLIEECRPPIVLGEQVASALQWVDLVSTDLETAGYAFGASDLCAAGFGGAHIRQRLYFVAMADTPERGRAGPCWRGEAQEQRTAECRGTGRLALTDGRERLGIADGQGRERDGQATGRLEGDGLVAAGLDLRGLADSASDGRREERADGGGVREGNSPQGRAAGLDAGGFTGRLADASIERRQQVTGGALVHEAPDGREGRHRCEPDSDSIAAGDGEDHRSHAPLLGREAVDWLFCRDGKWRPVEPGTFPLVDEAPARVGRLRAYGNALDLGTAQGFVEAVADALVGYHDALEVL